MCFVIFLGAWGYNWFPEIPDQLSTTKDINTSGGGGSQKQVPPRPVRVQFPDQSCMMIGQLE